MGVIIVSRRSLSVPPAGFIAARLVIVGLAVVLSATLLVAQTTTNLWKVPSFKARKKNPVTTSAESRRTGRTLFVKECLTCHGDTGSGDGPAAKDLEKNPGNLTDPKLWNESDGSVFFKITVGRRPMPAFRDMFTDEQRWHIVNYVRTLVPLEKTPEFEVPESVRQSITRIMDIYFQMQSAMANDQIDQIRAAGPDLTIETAWMTSPLIEDELPQAARAPWAKSVKALQQDVKLLTEAQDIVAARKSFQQFSAHLAMMLAKFGHADRQAIFLFRCKQVFRGAGAVWCQREQTVKNPYYKDEANPNCGQLIVRFHATVTGLSTNYTQSSASK